MNSSPKGCRKILSAAKGGASGHVQRETALAVTETWRSSGSQCCSTARPSHIKPASCLVQPGSLVYPPAKEGMHIQLSGRWVSRHAVAAARCAGTELLVLTEQLWQRRRRLQPPDNSLWKLFSWTLLSHLVSYTAAIGYVSLSWWVHVAVLLPSQARCESCESAPPHVTLLVFSCTQPSFLQPGAAPPPGAMQFMTWHSSFILFSRLSSCPPVQAAAARSLALSGC